MKLFVENYSTVGYITVMAIPGGPGDNTNLQKQILIKNLEGRWRADFDGDGLIDIIWYPISHVRSSGFEVPQKHKIALYQIYKK